MYKETRISVIGCLAVLSAFSLFFTVGSALADNDEFIVADGSRFEVGASNRPWFYAGTNNYYLGIDNISTAVADEVISDMKQMNLNVIRLWGFNDDQNKSTKLQGPNAGEYIEANFQMLDYVLDQANQNDIRVIMPLTNNWGDYGGMQQYMDWNGGGSKDDFYGNVNAQTDYQNYLWHLANRVNSENGRTYKNDPTILAWQLANEPRYQTDPNVGNGSVLSTWINNSADYLQNTLGVQQMVTVGMEGFYDTSNAAKGGKSWMDNEGTDFISQHAGADVDLTGFHLYADHWSMTEAESTAWIANHIRDARRDLSLGKPVIMDEFGRSVPPNTMAQRDQSYKSYLATAYREMVNGTNFWILYHDAYPNYDNFGVYYPADASTNTLIKDHAGKIQFLNNTGVHQLLSFEYDDEGFTKTWLDGGQVSDIQQVETPSWDLTNDGAIQISVSFDAYGDKAMIGAELNDSITGLAGIDVSDYGYENLLARIMVEGNSSFDAGDLHIKLYDKTGAGWSDASGGGLDILAAETWYELVWSAADAGDLSDLKEIGIDIWANGAYEGNIHVDFIGGDLTWLLDNLPGDVNGDGFVGGDDLNTVLSNWGLSEATRQQGDLTGEGDVGGADYTMVLSNWGAGTPPPGPSPEPATLAVLGLGLLPVLLRRKRRT